MFVAKVAAGRALVTTEEELDLPDARAPPGYDSVVGEPAPGRLNYDELVVYDESAALPAHLIVYSFGGDGEM